MVEIVLDSYVHTESYLILKFKNVVKFYVPGHIAIHSCYSYFPIQNFYVHITESGFLYTHQYHSAVHHIIHLI